MTTPKARPSFATVARTKPGGARGTQVQDGATPLLLTKLRQPAIEPEIGDDAQIMDSMLRMIRNGVSPAVAAHIVGISRTSYFRWRQRARQPRPPAHIRRFESEIQMAKAQWIAK